MRATAPSPASIRLLLARQPWQVRLTLRLVPFVVVAGAPLLIVFDQLNLMPWRKVIVPGIYHCYLPRELAPVETKGTESIDSIVLDYRSNEMELCFNVGPNHESKTGSRGDATASDTAEADAASNGASSQVTVIQTRVFDARWPRGSYQLHADFNGSRRHSTVHVSGRCIWPAQVPQLITAMRTIKPD